jgi:hypothetical protein
MGESEAKVEAAGVEEEDVVEAEAEADWRSAASSALSLARSSCLRVRNWWGGDEEGGGGGGAS